MVRVIACDEYQDLPLGLGATGISPGELAALTSTWQLFTGRSPTGFFEYGPASIKPKNWAGIISGRDVALQVMPKGAQSLSGDDQALLDRNLGEMLRVTLDQGAIPLARAGIAMVGSRFDKAVEALCDLVLVARRKRVLRHYRVRNEPARAFRGQIDWARQDLHTAIRPGSFLSREVELDEGTLANRFLKSALLRFQRRCTGRVARRVDEVLAEFEKVEPVADPVANLGSVDIGRLSQDYRQAIFLAKQLLGGGAGGLFAGSLAARSEVVFMPELFEAFVWRLVRDLAPRYGFIPDKKPVGRFLGMWASGPQRGRNAFEVQTDAEVARRGADSPTAIVDAKWKWLNVSGSSMGVDPSDVYQMIAYGRRLEPRRTILAFPKLGRLQDGDDDVSLLRLKGQGASSEIALVFIPLLWAGLREASASLEAALAAVA